MKTNKFSKILFLHSLIVFAFMVAGRISDAFGAVRLQFLGTLSYGAAPLAFSYAVKTGILAATERVEYDVDKPLYSDKPKMFAIMRILDKLKRSGAATTTVKGFEERMAPDISTLTAAVSTASASAGDNVVLPVQTGYGKFFYANQTVKLLLAPSSSSYTVYGKVVSVSSDNVTVAPIDSTKILGRASHATTGVPSTTRVLLTGNMNPENDDAVLNPSVRPNIITNNTQTVRNNFMISLEGAKERLYSVDEVQRLSENMHFEHAKALYKSMLFNGPAKMTSQSTSADVQVNYARGIESDILLNSTKNVEYDGTLSNYDTFETFQFGLFDLNIAGGSDTRIALANKACRKFFTDQKKNKGWYIFNNDEMMDVFGIPGVKTVETDSGRFDLIVDGVVDRVYPTIDEPYLMAIQPMYLTLRDYIKTTQRANIQNPLKLARMDECYTTITMLLYLAEAFGVWRKVLPSS